MCLLLSADPLRACTFDGVFTNPFTESYPGALDVALATQREVSKGTFTVPVLREGRAGLQQTSWWLKLFNTDLRVAQMKEVYFYVIDSHLWAKKTTDRLEIHVAKPTQPKKVLIVSAAALSSLASDQISYQDALALGVAQISGIQ
ncbi:hypothetical protein R1T29_00625 [Vibrio parahaemolyticus]|uniref:hypothetical protein n=1 Tax=Vibrio parahaemolyticus TaxID=670 RepID=UPI0029550368|nr:hypothetical protein [Vibrio parahaemolyticus]WOO27787.1 hypothetical protein R1T29_00625 [Vibrio parahaemolyticus]